MNLSNPRNPCNRRRIIVALTIAASLTALVSCDDPDTSTNTADTATGDTGDTPTSAATTDTVSPATTGSVTAVPDPCPGTWTLTTYELNDRCIDPATSSPPVPPPPLPPQVVIDTCAKAPATTILAVPNRVLVAVAPGTLLAGAVGAAREALAGIGVSSVSNEEVSGNAYAVLDLDIEGKSPEDVTNLVASELAALQGDGYTVDLDYYEPLEPNDGFRPGDDPTKATEPTADSAPEGEAAVLIIDSPFDDAFVIPDVQRPGTDVAVDYDAEPNGYVDEDHAHGGFVASVVQFFAPNASVSFHGVMPPATTQRWSPMLFQDSDLLRALEDAYGVTTDSNGGLDAQRHFDLINLSLGGAGCPGQIGERLAIAEVLRTIAGDGTMVVAAAGNEPTGIPHYPAAWHSTTTFSDFAGTVAGAGGPGEAHLIELGEWARASTIAVGSTTGTYSNCGDWINAATDGTQIGRYPVDAVSTLGWAKWSGTSFATARVTALLAGNSTYLAAARNGAPVDADGVKINPSSPLLPCSP